MIFTYLSYLVLGITAAILIYVAYADLRYYAVSNIFILLLIGLFFLHGAFSGQLTTVYWNLGVSLLIFIFLLYFFAKNQLGGGDVKLLTVAYLWSGVSCALPLAILLLFFTLLYTVAVKIGWAPAMRSGDGRTRVPFAPAVAAAMIGIFMLGCLGP